MLIKDCKTLEDINAKRKEIMNDYAEFIKRNPSSYSFPTWQIRELDKAEAQLKTEYPKDHIIYVSVIHKAECEMGFLHNTHTSWEKLTDSQGHILKFTKKEAEHYVEIYSNQQTGCYKIQKVNY